METINTEQIIARPGMYRQYAGGYFNVLISPEQSAGAMSMVDFRLPKGAEPPMHMHRREDEIWHVLEGEIAFNIGGDEVVARAGEAVFGPRGIPHKFSLKTPQARVINIITPGDFVNYFMEFSKPVEGEPQITPPQGPPPLELIQRMSTRLSQQYGVMLV